MKLEEQPRETCLAPSVGGGRTLKKKKSCVTLGARVFHPVLYLLRTKIPVCAWNKRTRVSKNTAVKDRNIFRVLEFSLSKTPKCREGVTCRCQGSLTGPVYSTLLYSDYSTVRYSSRSLCRKLTARGCQTQELST